MEQKKNYDKLVKALQIAAGIFIVGMVIAGAILMKKYDISVKNAGMLKDWLQGNPLTVALIIIAFNFVKAFALVITPSLVFVVCGIVFDDLWVAILVSMICIATSIPVPYYLGRFMGKNAADSLKNKYPKIKRFDEFIEDNSFMVVFLIKATGLIPSDSSSMLLGAMNVKFKTFFLATNLGEIPIIVTWALLGNKGNFSDPKSFLYILPVIATVVLASVFMKLWTNKKSAAKDKAAADETEKET